MSAHLRERNVCGSDSALHMASHATVGDNITVRRAWNRFTISHAVGPDEHVCLRAVVRAEGSASSRRLNILSGILAGFMALHAKLAKAAVSYGGCSVVKSDRSRRAQLMRVFSAMGIMTGCAVDRHISGVGRRSRAFHSIRKTHGCVTPDARFAARPTGGSSADRVL